MSTREQFEAWFEKRGVWPRLTYLEVWQAALSAQRPESTQAMADEQLTEMWQELNNAACRSTMDRTPVYLQFAHALLAAPAQSGEINQCDGCRVKAPLTERGIHRYSDGSLIGCTANRYAAPAQADAKQVSDDDLVFKLYELAATHNGEVFAIHAHALLAARSSDVLQEIEDLKHDNASLLKSLNGEAAEVDRLTAQADSAPIAPSADAVEMILRDVCETDPADPDLMDTVCISTATLQEIVERHVSAAPTPTAPTADAKPVADLSKLYWLDQSTANPVEKARRVLGQLIEPNAVYFFDDGYPRCNSIASQAACVLTVLNALAAEKVTADAVDERAAFEAWWGCDTSGPESLSAWNGWQARAALASSAAEQTASDADVRASVLEEAAQLADTMTLYTGYDVAQAIRALKEPK